MLKIMVKSLVMFVFVAVGYATMASVAGAAFPGDNGPMAYDQSEESGADVWVIQPDGTGDHQITTSANDVYNYDPAFNNGSRKIVYTQENDNNEPFTESLHLVNTDGTGDVPLTGSSIDAVAGSFSPSNTKVVFAKEDVQAETSEIWTINTDGTGLTQLTAGPNDGAPVYSPDGTKIAWIRLDELWLMNADGSNQHEIADNVANFQTRPSFNPAGTRIAFESDEFESPDVFFNAGIQSVALDGSDRQAEVENQGADRAEAPNWSPDGASLGYIYFLAQQQLAADSNPYTPAGSGFNISTLSTGDTTRIRDDSGSPEYLDWGNLTPPVPPPAQCKMRFSKARFFVFRHKPVYRLVAKYYSETSGKVNINFFARNQNGSKGQALGSVSKELSGNGTRFRIRKTVSKSMAKKLRTSKYGYLADITIPAMPDYCDMSYSVQMSVLKHVKKQFVWFQVG